MTEKEMAAAVVAAVRKGITDATAKLLERIEGLEASIAEIPAGRDGRDGTHGDKGERGTHGRDGTNGKDALGFDNLSVEHDGERGFTIKFTNGDRVKEFAFVIPCVIDRGFWKEGTKAERGDCMTYGGSSWIAQTETQSKPEMGNADWRLSTKRGRDGKDGDRGPQGDKGIPGPRHST